MTVFAAPHRLPQTKAYRSGNRPPVRRGSLLFSVSVPGLLPFHSDIFHPKSCTAWGQARGGRVWGPNWGVGWGRKSKKKRKAAGTHLLGAGQEGGPGPGKSAISCPAPPPGFLSVCVTQGLSPLGAAPNSRRCRCPPDRETPPGEEMCFQAARSQLPNLSDVLPSVHIANQGEKTISGCARLQSAGQCGQQIPARCRCSATEGQCKHWTC